MCERTRQKVPVRGEWEPGLTEAFTFPRIPLVPRTAAAPIAALLLAVAGASAASAAQTLPGATGLPWNVAVGSSAAGPEVLAWIPSGAATFAPGPGGAWVETGRLGYPGGRDPVSAVAGPAGIAILLQDPRTTLMTELDPVMLRARVIVTGQAHPEFVPTANQGAALVALEDGFGAAWLRSRGSGDDVHVLWSEIRPGGAWSEPAEVARFPYGGVADAPWVEIDRSTDGALAVVVSDEAQLILARRVGGAWRPPTHIELSRDIRRAVRGGGPPAAAVASLGGGRVALVWGSSRATARAAFVAADGTVALAPRHWGPGGPVDIAATADGRAVAAWTASTRAGRQAGRHTVRVATLDATGRWGAPRPAGQLQGSVTLRPRAAMADDGSVLVVWATGRDPSRPGLVGAHLPAGAAAFAPSRRIGPQSAGAPDAYVVAPAASGGFTVVWGAPGGRALVTSVAP